MKVAVFIYFLLEKYQKKNRFIFLNKTLEFDRSIVDGVNYKIFSEDSKKIIKLKKIEKSTLFHISDKYVLAINRLFVYLEDKELNENYFCETTSEYELGKTNLIYKLYK
ncbi:hypothetical protein [Paraclostridium sordellii]|uniref:hypothetical protein n=1 Tax=Paraclostridium sordellii TaxID=1505 RepID=UPI0005E36F57|nr:hypothetical protein [Paeniclostridium sordellii]CEO21668.1 Uncharacterised protein [[Clostridium] sordellii] [Paeniclostridium sordellii]CEQ09466.1 Uncharacterised protein [[Clostridium] sordellii] [Paeniclostridium sordellii]CEQ13803.1 Uncharacterised protein [[Clostridium] sordellii] [Paeniclostridium sordellii]